jgi:hypothetical protein
MSEYTLEIDEEINDECNNESDEEDDIIIEEEIEFKDKKISIDTPILFNNYTITINSINEIKKNMLLKYTYDEVIGILLQTNNIINKGASIIIDELEFEKLTSLKFFNNYEQINEITASLICIMLKCIPIHVKKNNKIFNRFDDSISNEYLYFCKKILRILNQNNKNINFTLLQKIFPILFMNLYSDVILNEEIEENNKLRNLLTKFS